MHLIVLPAEDLTQTAAPIHHLRERIGRLTLLTGNDRAEQRRARRYADALGRFAESRGLTWRVDVETLEEGSREGVDRLAANHGGDASVAFLSVGAPWATLLLARAFGETTPFYTFDAFDNRLVTIRGGQSRFEEAERMDLAAYCGLLGYEILERKERTRVLAEASLLEALFKEQGPFQKVRRQLIHHGHASSTSHTHILETLEKLGIVKHGKLVEGMKNRLQGDLFEEYVYHICQRQGYDDIALGCRILFNPEENDPHRHVANEFDILFIDDNRIGTVECKYVHRLDGENFLYKYDAVIDYFGRTARALIVNITQRERKKEQRGPNFTLSMLRRSQLGNVRIYHDTLFNYAKFTAHLRAIDEEI